MGHVPKNVVAVIASTGLAVCASLGLSTACKSRLFHTGDNAAAVKNAAPIVPAVATFGDNRSEEWGSKGTSDDHAATSDLPRFKLKADYPATPDYLTPEPPAPDIAAIRGADSAAAHTASQAWLIAMQNYIYEGMNDQDAANPNANFRFADPTRTSFKRWYHMPWLHTPKVSSTTPGRGREGIWGLTRELDMGTTTAADWPKITGKGCTGTDWGIGFFNEPGAYAIGQVFPAGDQAFPEKATFPKGTVSFKILFTSVKPDVLSAIDGAWTIRALVNGGGACGRAANGSRILTEMRHVQMDVMMKWGDGPHDWIFGGYVYNKDARNQYWQGMEPLGVQTGVKQEETVVTAPTFKPNGYMNRLNGPADNPNASCLSCHARAQWPELATSRVPFAPKDASDTEIACILHEWGGEGDGKCRKCGAGGCLPTGVEPILPGNVSLDYSMQFGLALRNREVLFKSR